MNRRETLTLLAAAGLTVAGPGRAQSSVPSSRSVVLTRHGPVAGQSVGGVVRFLGLPYGADTGPARFQPPRPPEAWSQIRDASDYGPSCPQATATPQAQGEDCLRLNIFTPDASARRKRPVMVYIHGGAYMTGSGSDPLYDGSALCTRGDVVVVTLNHRLNALGYLYLARIEREVTGQAGPLAASGNAGQLDLHLALTWMRDNISQFGGDSARVMVFGQSGGGAKIATMLATPAAHGLFQRAATMSGQQVTVSGPGHADTRARTYLSALGLKPDSDGLRLIQSAPAQTLIDALKVTDPILGEGGVYMGPVLDEIMLTRHPFYPDASPLSLKVPMMTGNTHDETRYFLGHDPKTFALDWPDLPARLSAQMRVDIDPDTVIAAYRRLYPARSASEVFFAATTASRSWRGAIIEDELRARAGAPAFAYQLDWTSPKDGGKWGACHTMDIPLVFGTTGVKDALTTDSPGARAMSAIMSDAFIAFARNGSPQTTALPHWTPYGLARRETMLLDLPPKLAFDPRGEERKLFEAVPFIQSGT